MWQMEAQIQHLREKFGLGTGPTNQAVAEWVGAPKSAEDSSTVVPASIATQALSPLVQDVALLDEVADFL